MEIGEINAGETETGEGTLTGEFANGSRNL
jgi:hypothetical protein